MFSFVYRIVWLLQQIHMWVHRLDGSQRLPGFANHSPSQRYNQRKVSHAVDRARPHHVCPVYRYVLCLYCTSWRRGHRRHRWFFYRRRCRRHLPNISMRLATDSRSCFAVRFRFRHRCGGHPVAVTTRCSLRYSSKTNLRGGVDNVGGRFFPMGWAASCTPRYEGHLPNLTHHTTGSQHMKPFRFCASLNPTKARSRVVQSDDD